ncbi:ORF6N domain-containing protein [Olivibacter sp. 47]|uniref:ORF6N domain-containing protein n=1 Tax=Olivibacter sp. 47 TaxID=3056486 RepID=UPI0025A3350C|nr:ORF6N domain-containing protein [Olivibacter sp. 47]MDM8177758.1 ORF6N domain-containing protein [Olivibacter sp. 47]
MTKTKSDESLIIPEELVMNQIYYIRDQKVMLDRDLAELYGVETKVLNQAVRRNIDRFPEDFMFELSLKEYESLRSQFVTLKTRGAHSKYLPHVFTEQGVAMLSSVLNSKLAIQVNIQIIRVFTKLRQALADNTDLRLEIEYIKNELEKQSRTQESQNKNIDLIFSYIDRLQEKIETKPSTDKKRIGYEITGNK